MNKQEIEKAIHTLECAKLHIFENSNRQDYSLEALGRLSNAVDDAISALEKQLTNGWIPFTSEYDCEIGMEMLQGNIPDEDEEILVTDGENVWSDTFMRDGEECYLDSGRDLISAVMAWQPLPEPMEVTNG